MVQRTYNAPDFNVPDNRSISGTQVAQADTSIKTPIQFGDATWRDRMIEQLGGKASQTLAHMADIQYSNLYLEGQAAAGTVESEAELQGNPLTRDWQVAGYRDTMGKLALADTEAQFSQDILSLREQSPEKMQEYLAQRRAKLTPALSSMSREARASAAGQLLMQDRAAIKTHTTEHAKFIIEQKSQAVHTQWYTVQRSLGNTLAKARLENDFTGVDDQLKNAAATMVGSVWMDSSLPDNIKQQLTFEMIQGTLSNDAVELYDWIAQHEIPDGQGGTTTLIARLGEKEQTQLANGYREAMARTSDSRNLFQMAQVAKIEAQIGENKYTGSYDDLKQMLYPMVSRKAITGEKAAGILKSYEAGQLKAETDSELATLALRGDTHGILMAGKTEADAVAAVDARLAKIKASPAQVLDSYLQMGLNGVSAGFTKAGKVLGPSLRQVRSPDGTILPQHLATFEAINAAVEKARANGNNNARVSIMSGMDEQDRMFATRVFAQRDAGKTLDEAIGLAADAETREAEMSPSVRAATGAATAKDVEKGVMALEPQNILESSWTFAKSIFSKDAAADLTLQPKSQIGFRDGWFGDNPTARLYAETARQELRDEAGRVMLVNPTATSDDVLSTAKANLAARTISTRHGPVFLPYKADPTRIFGVSQANLSLVGPAIDKMLKETKADARWNVKYTHRGVFAQELDRDGNPIGHGNYIDPKNVRTAVESIARDQQEKASFRYGEGKTVSANGAKVKFSGANTVGVPNDWMFTFRDNLVTHEGVRNTPYADLSGRKDKAGKPIMTAGVGVSSHNPWYPQVGPDGKVSDDEIRKSFLAASNDAALSGQRVAKDLGLEGRGAFMLMSELAYQSGGGFMAQRGKTGDSYRMLAAALKRKDPVLAKQAFKQTAAWYYSADPKNRDAVTQRQRHYLALIDRTINGD